MDALRRHGVQRIVQVGADAIAVVLGDVGAYEVMMVLRRDRARWIRERRARRLVSAVVLRRS
jgi:hypothetical protein